jgi:hypothetical protein
MNVSLSIEFTEHICISCGCVFYVPDTFDTQRRRDKKSFFCYNGHSQAYVKSAEEEVREEMQRKLAERDRVIQSNAEYSTRLSRELNELKKKCKPVDEKPKPHGNTGKRKARRVSA